MAGAGQNPDIHTQTVGPTDTCEAPSLGPEASLRSMVCAADCSLNTCQGGGRLVGRLTFPSARLLPTTPLGLRSPQTTGAQGLVNLKNSGCRWRTHSRKGQRQ